MAMHIHRIASSRSTEGLERDARINDAVLIVVVPRPLSKGLTHSAFAPVPGHLDTGTPILWIVESQALKLTRKYRHHAADVMAFPRYLPRHLTE